MEKKQEKDVQEVIKRIDKNFILAGNFKMNKLPNEIIEYYEKFIYACENILKKRKISVQQDIMSNIDILTYVPYTNIFYANLSVEDSEISIGAQNMHYAENGAYTGEISAEMLRSVGVTNVLIGHSERRAMGETNEEIRKKLLASKRATINPTLCIGETLEEKEKGKTKEVLKKQLIEAIDVEKLDSSLMFLRIAYEPIWAIGTGNSCEPEEANETIGYIKSVLKEMGIEYYISVLYGGSVNPDNIGELVRQENIDGVLVGGASLSHVKFANMYQKVLDYCLE